MNQESGEKVEKKRAPRKRVTRPASAVSAVEKPPRKRAPRKKVEKDISQSVPLESTVTTPAEELIQPLVTERKAPTNIGLDYIQKQTRKKQTLIIATILFLGLVSSAGVGLTDEGQINIQQTIEERNEKILTDSGEAPTEGMNQVAVPVQNTTGHTGATLKGKGSSGNKVPAESETTSTTTEPSTETADQSVGNTEIVATTTENDIDSLTNADSSPDIEQKEEEALFPE
jgi:hypothetical protein